MRYVLTFAFNTAGYRCHAQGCSAAVTKRHTQNLIEPETFDSIEAAHAWADNDEQQKGGQRANFKVCKCSKVK